MEQETRTYRNFKVVIIGKSAVGKSCLLVRFVEDRFDTNYLSTIGVDFQFKTFEIGDDKFRLDIWDTAGQERYSVGPLPPRAARRRGPRSVKCNRTDDHRNFLQGRQGNRDRLRRDGQRLLRRGDQCVAEKSEGIECGR